MKQFFKYVLATVVGMLIVSLLSLLSMVVMMVGMASTSTVATVEENTVLVINLDGMIEERAPQDNPLLEAIGNPAATQQGLDQLLAAIRRAEKEENIKGIYIEAGTFAGASPAMLEELRNALVAFKKNSGKFIVSYSDTYTQGAYYLCSVADSVVINPSGMIDWKGLSLSTMYYKDVLDKAGIHMQVFKVGTYKSAVEPYTSSEMSEANREQLTVMSNEMWGKMVEHVGKSRGIKAEKLNELADSMQMFVETKEYLKSKLVDKIEYSDYVPTMLANLVGVDDADDYRTITPAELAGITASEPKGTSGNIVAVYYAYGDIVDEVSTSGFDTEHHIVGQDVIRDLKKLADDDDVKAVVMRVNSPGGSAYASEQIWHQIMNIKAKKPIIVSMGGYAASGGYYISCAADYIYAEPTTLTGSIGIFGMFPEAHDLLENKLGLHVHTVKTNKHSDFGSSLMQPLNDGERALMQRYINNGYELFTKRCADGRKMSQDDIKKIAEGRVWTGMHAKEIGLVDKLGSLEDAIAEAKKRAELTDEDCTVMSYPAEPSFFESLMDGFNSRSYADAKMQEVFGDYYNVFSSISNIKNKTGVQAALPYYIMFE